MKQALGHLRWVLRNSEKRTKGPLSSSPNCISITVLKAQTNQLCWLPKGRQPDPIRQRKAFSAVWNQGALAVALWFARALPSPNSLHCLKRLFHRGPSSFPYHDASTDALSTVMNLKSWLWIGLNSHWAVQRIRKGNVLTPQAPALDLYLGWTSGVVDEYSSPSKLDWQRLNYGLVLWGNQDSWRTKGTKFALSPADPPWNFC